MDKQKIARAKDTWLRLQSALENYAPHGPKVNHLRQMWDQAMDDLDTEETEAYYLLLRN